MEDDAALTNGVPITQTVQTARVISKEVLRIAEHTVSLLAALGSIWLVHLALQSLLGHDATFFDLLPVRYVVDAGHLAVFVRFVWKLITQIWK